MRMFLLNRGRRMLGFSLLALLLPLAFAAPAMAQGPSAKQSSTPRTWHVLVSIDSTDHSIMGMGYLPANIWINVGDTVVWTANSAEPHTVTFPRKGSDLGKFDPNSPHQVLPSGGSVYDGHSYYNSGLISSQPGGFPGGTSYTLTFGVTGTFHYACFLHPMMDGVVHVRPAGTPYPFTQTQYSHQANDEGRELLADGHALAREVREDSSSHHVNVGADDGMAMVMLFFPGTVTIDVGDTIVFRDNYPIDDPHTVTFGAPPQAFPPVQPYGNPENFVGQNLNSGLLGTHTSWISRTVGNSYSVTFNKAGTYQFYCDIHFGMAINIVVK